jgi:hypothetical protein
MTDVPRQPRQSPLEKHPEYVTALGMIAIELANLEFVYSDMLGAILRIGRDTAKALYFTPKSSQARMETLESVIANVLEGSPLLAPCESFIKRGLRILNKRNAMLHDVWGVSKEDKTEVVRMTFPSGKRTPVKLTTLTDMIRDLRVLADEVTAGFEHLLLRPHYAINITYQVGPKADD